MVVQITLTTPLSPCVLDTTLCFFPGTRVSSNNRTDRHDITEISLKVALDIINPNPLTTGRTIPVNSNKFPFRHIISNLQSGC
jgi:hypothetical protein